MTVINEMPLNNLINSRINETEINIIGTAALANFLQPPGK